MSTLFIGANLADEHINSVVVGSQYLGDIAQDRKYASYFSEAFSGHKSK